MLEPALPDDEVRRLESLHSLCMLDTFAEERFDRVTRLAARLFNVPSALVTLVDGRRQWFKSRHGLETCETDRRVSFCGHTILSDDPLVVPDCLTDARFRDNPLVLGAPHIRFYAGQPIHAPDGSRIGTLCLIDRQPRAFSPSDRALLDDLAAMVDHEIKLGALSTIDELTRVSNRRGFTMLAEHVLALCHRQAQVATLLSIGLHGVRRINATHGKAAGDELLRQFAALLTRHFRTSDVVARIRGDEFCVLCSGATQEQMQASLQRFEATVSGSPIRRTHPTLSWSVGLVQFDPAFALNVDALVEAADLKMHDAKRLRETATRQ